MTSQRKRVGSSCIPCYTRKQKCNRQYPCNQCTRRRRPEQCAYNSSQATQTTTSTTTPESRRNCDDQCDMQATDGQWQQVPESSSLESSTSSKAVGNTKEKVALLSLTEVFGYFEGSKSNTIALVRKLGVNELSDREDRHVAIAQETATEAKKALQEMPSRSILDFLVQYFVAEVNWIDKLLYPPRFLAQYQKWWNNDGPTSVPEMEFAVLFLRLCSYASQFLPSPSYTVDSIRGMALADIRSCCDRVASSLSHICVRLDAQGSLVRVQHLAYTGLTSLCKGQTNMFWECLSSAICVAQRIGLHVDADSQANSMDELEKEMRRRTFCNLYIWDSILSRRLDRIPFLPTGLSRGNMPQMHLAPDLEDGAEAPDVFTERVLHAQLAEFWRAHSPENVQEYDSIEAEGRYEKFCSEFLPKIPPVFALLPDKQWDERVPTVPLQRQILHMDIFDSLCHNFKLLLFQDPANTQRLPGYKQTLLSSQKKVLVVAAMKLLDGASVLHLMIGGSHTRFPCIITSTFEAAVLLLSLYSDKTFLEDTYGDKNMYTVKPDPLGAALINITRADCIEAANGALTRLKTLADVSKMAAIGAKTLSRLISKITNSTALVPLNGDANTVMVQEMQESESWGSARASLSLGGDSLTDFLSTSGSEYVDTNWDELVAELGNASEIGTASSLDT